MKITEIAFKQYGSYRDETIVPVSDGITGIIGIYDATNLKSNGSGKSTLIRAINYAIYGEDEGKKVESIICDQVPSNEIDMWVRVKFNHNGFDYQITRGRKKTSPYLLFVRFENGSEITIGDKETDIRSKQKLINDVVGMDFDMFTATVFFEQRKADKFINTESSKSQAYLDSVLNLDSLRAAIKNGSSKLNKLLDSCTRNKDSIVSINNDIETIAEEIAGKDALIAQIDQCKLNIETVSAELDALVAESSKFEEAEVLMSRLSALSANIKSTEATITSNKAKLIDNSKKISDAKAEIESKTKTAESIPSTIEKATDDLANAKSEVSKSNEIVLNSSMMKSNLSSERTSIKTLLSNLSAPKCERCNREITDEYRDLNNKIITQRISDIDAEITKIDKQLSDVSKTITDYNTIISECEASIKKNNLILNDCTSKIKYNNELIVTIEDSSENIHEVIEKSKELLEDLSKEFDEVNAKAEYVKTINISDIKTQIGIKTRLLNSYKSTSDQLNRAVGSLDEKERRCGELRASIENLNKVVEETTDKIDTYEIVSTVFKKMIDDMFNQSVKLIEYYANNLIQQVYPNFAISIHRDKTKKLEPIMFEFICDGRSREYARLSGGQKTVADICLRLGFSKTLMDISNAKINFICLDEPFESLDEFNRDLIKQIFLMESKTFPQIIIISHTPDAKDFEHTIEVHMSADGISYVKGGAA